MKFHQEDIEILKEKEYYTVFPIKTEFSQKLMQIIENLHLGRLLRKDIMTMANDKFSFDTAVSKIKSYL